MQPILRAPLTVAQSGGRYDLTWQVIADGGATFATGGAHTLASTVGQLDAGTLTGGAYTLVGGFWDRAGRTSGSVYLPLVVR